MENKIGNYRWTICALVFFATTVNYLDRQVLSLLQPYLAKLFSWSNTDYANITSVFQFGYAISLLFAGRIIDKLGTKKGYAWAIIIWSVAAVIHAVAIPIGQGISIILGWFGIVGFSVSILGFMFSRAALAFGEAGNFPAAIKATAEYFPKKERSLATGIFNSGTNVGAILAPLTVPWISENWGWEAAFVVMGIIGFLWLLFWFKMYEKPEKQKKLSVKELDYINSQEEETIEKVVQTDNKSISWTKLLGYRQTWAFIAGKFFTDGVWWFFLFWLPAYLNAQYDISGTAITWPLATLYTIATVGSIVGGWFPMYFINRGHKVFDGRMKAMLVIAFIPLVILLAQPFGFISYWVPVVLIGIGASAHQAWSANIFTTVSDLFPKNAIGSVVGIGGMAGGLGGVLVSKMGGWLFDKYKQVGIAKSWAKAQTQNLSEFIEKIKNTSLINKNNELINLNSVELKSLPTDALEKLQNIDQNSLAKLMEIQKQAVQNEMMISYSIMFGYCAIAYLMAWIVIKILVPKYKAITDL